MEHGAEPQSPGWPVPGAGAELRRAVHALRAGERRRVFPAAIHVGRVDDRVAFEVAPGQQFDDGLRRDVTAALLRLADCGSGAWLTRPGHPEPHDLDARWAPSLVAAFRERGLVPAFVAVVTKNGWYDPFGSGRATWKRLRIR